MFGYINRRCRNVDTSKLNDKYPLWLAEMLAGTKIPERRGQRVEPRQEQEPVKGEPIERNYVIFPWKG